MENLTKISQNFPSDKKKEISHKFCLFFVREKENFPSLKKHLIRIGKTQTSINSH